MAKPVKHFPLSKKYVIFLSLLALAGLAIFVIAFIGMLRGSWLGQLNEPLLYWFSTHRNSTINTLAQITTASASPTFFVIIASIGSVYWAFKKREIWRPFLMTISIITSATASSVIKLLIQNPRPDRFDMVPPIETGFSFPSGHTICTIVFLLTVGYLFYSRYRANDRRFWLIVWLLATTLGTAIIAMTRMYLGYHWLTDVVASIGLGLIIFAIMILIDKMFVRNYKKLTKLI